MSHERSFGNASFAWQELGERVGAFLRAEGMPPGEANRLSREIIRLCADAADSIDRDQLGDRALDEARTLLQTWQASRREQALARV